MPWFFGAARMFDRPALSSSMVRCRGMRLFSAFWARAAPERKRIGRRAIGATVNVRARPLSGAQPGPWAVGECLSAMAPAEPSAICCSGVFCLAAKSAFRAMLSAAVRILGDRIGRIREQGALVRRKQALAAGSVCLGCSGRQSISQSSRRSERIGLVRWVEIEFQRLRKRDDIPWHDRGNHNDQR